MDNFIPGVISEQAPPQYAPEQYYNTRKKWDRPQAMVWAKGDGLQTPDHAIKYPAGKEGEDFIVVSDHNRAPISISKQRMENRLRMINGNMRSYHTADKITISTSWNLLPSRAFADQKVFENGEYITKDDCYYTADHGAGGVDLLQWYDNTPGAFWVYLSYDNYSSYGNDFFNHIKDYGERYMMFFSEFSYSIEKRGLYDMWNVSVGLEEA